jgi:hypothetical protein
MGITGTDVGEKWIFLFSATYAISSGLLSQFEPYKNFKQKIIAVLSSGERS